MKASGSKALCILLIALLAVVGGTARHRPAELEPPADPRISAAPSGEASAAGGAEDAETGGEFAPPADGVPAEETAAEPERFSLNFVGDCTLAANPAYQGGPNGYDTITGGDFSYPFAKTLSYFSDDDFTFANLECCLTETREARAKTFVFRTGPEYARVLTEGSVEFVTLANNHVLDFGQQGYDDTKAAVAAEGIAYAGRDEYELYETERGLKIGVYAVSFGTVEQIQAGIQKVRDAGAEFVIAALHWGDEGSYQVNPDQRAQGHAAVEAGADFVYGSHPHTLQPVEEYQGVLIYYSMGNWTFGGNTNPRDKDTLILHLTVERAADGSVRVVEAENIPCSCSGEESYNNYQPVPLSEDDPRYARVLSKLDGSFTGADLSIGYGYTANE